MESYVPLIVIVKAFALFSPTRLLRYSAFAATSFVRTSILIIDGSTNRHLICSRVPMLALWQA
jgi:hypothetical protein